MREHSWFAADGEEAAGQSIPLEAYLHRLATRHLEQAGATVRLRELSHDSPREAVARVSRWRWLSLRLPPDLLIASLHSAGPHAPTTDRVSLVSAQLAHVLSQPVAETHLHEKAAFSFSQLWSSWMGWFLRQVPRADATVLQGHSWPFGGQSAFTGMLLAAAITRTLMAGYLLRLAAGQRASFAEFCREAVERTAAGHHGRPALGDHVYWCGGAMRMLLSGSGGVDLASLCHSYRRLVIRDAPPRRPRTLEELYAADPIAGWFRGVPGRVLSETVFTTHALRAIRSELVDAEFTRFFWQYQRVRCRAYDFLVLEPGTAGLDWFQRYFSRLKAFRGDMDATLFEAALEHESADLHLGALELRRTPPESWAMLCRDVQKLAEGSLGFHHRQRSGEPAVRTEVGLVFHFVKENLNTRHPQHRLHADPEGNGTGVRFGDWYSEQRRRALAIVGALERFPSMQLLIRGLDVASTELSAPTWVTLGILEEARRASVHASRVLAARGAEQPLPRLGVTYHVGEDFRRLVEGLRRIHEVVDFGALRQGDRIGHGVALSISPRLWARNARMIPQPAEERIDDLLWELERYQRGDFTGRGSRRELVRTELRRLLRDVFGDPSPDLDMYLEARRLRHVPELLERLGYPRRVAPGSVGAHPENALEIVRRYLTSTAWFQRGLRPVPVTIDDGEVSMLEEAQQWLRWLLGRQEITIESNPSSNLLTSDLGVHEVPPALRLTLGPSQRGAKKHRPPAVRASEAPLLVSINTDDPVTFATRLADEYVYFYSGLRQANLTAQEALEWVDRVRLAGWRSRFTLPASSDPRYLDEVASRWRAVLKPWSRRLRPSSAPHEVEQEPEEVEAAPPPGAPSSSEALDTFEEEPNWEL
ncbi:hypothetical protein HPC49_08795 [Pyxidicoccus fallax]|uniref:Adenosine deaminase n=1 Tax=Pyxidicoccus fallax TaxID=394095 RepID=A0A848LB77_9BACT|nr:hypothetical protein [Pyxidicoccus fallax]NMO13943.1 hypothetical protein [Pyxidicoccus fallax]NPC78342.1 hypothetical protein [Pyxidicoccus fallax]